MMTATFQYLCRRCRKFTDGVSTSIDNAYSILIAVATDNPKLEGLEIGGKSMFSAIVIHDCRDGGSGLADLIGYRKEDK